MALAGQDQLPYYDGKPEGFVQSADILFILDTGEELPVHSALLCGQSSVFCDMFNLSRPQADDILRRISLTECTREAACSWLSYVYDPKKQCSCVEAETVLELAHKFNMQAILDSFNDILSRGPDPWVSLADKTISVQCYYCKDHTFPSKLHRTTACCVLAGS